MKPIFSISIFYSANIKTHQEHAGLLIKKSTLNIIDQSLLPQAKKWQGRECLAISIPIHSTEDRGQKTEVR